MWEQRSSVTFEKKKTVLIHFTRNDVCLSNAMINIKKQKVQSATEVKLLEVIMNRELHYRNHIILAATKRLKVAMTLKRLQIISLLMMRQLFTCMVALIVYYAMIVWKHACNVKAMTAFNRVQKVEAQAVTDTFITVFTVIAKTEACLKPMWLQQAEKAVTT